MKRGSEFSWRVSSKESGTRLLQFLKEKCPEAPSVKAIKRAIDNKLCTVNGRIETFSSHLLDEDDHVVLNKTAFDEKKVALRKISTLHEDEDLLIIHKPAGLICELRAINHVLPQYKGGLILVHRLDKETSGVLILAKNAIAEKKMIALFKERKVSKIYLALVDKKISKEEGTIDNYLGKKHSYQGQTIYGAVERGKGQRAITHWKCLKRGKQASLLRCELETGRTHQLRVHLSGMGHPILGDTQYAKRFECPSKPARNMLHAYIVAFEHPSTGKKIKATAPIPSDFQELLQSVIY